MPEIPQIPKLVLLELTTVVREIGRWERRYANVFHEMVERRLRESGWSVIREWPVPYRDARGTRRGGRVDLWVESPHEFAVELDNVSPRAGSIAKIQATGRQGVVVTRCGWRNEHREDFVVVGCEAQ